MLALVDSGEELARRLKTINWRSPDTALAQLKDVISPTIQLCDEETRCAFTGHRLLDIWRFFRHTWALEYRSIPGRQMPVLVRNKARPNWPVIGIGLLASPVMRTRPRDAWIGWLPDQLADRLVAGSWDATETLSALRERIDASISEVRADDLVAVQELNAPTERTLMRLEQRAAGAAAARNHQLQQTYAEAVEADESVKSTRSRLPKGEERWLLGSAEPLFVRKRAETLCSLLYAKRAFQQIDWTKKGSDLIEAVFGTAAGQRAVSIALQEVRKAGLSSQVADVSVCGAVAPYNELLGGKLVALLMTSGEVREAYKARYSGHVSIISSQVAGRPITRPADLKILTTTSLYGNASSQYNRLRLRAAEHEELTSDVEWVQLEKTAGFGTVHLGPMALRLLREVSEKSFGGRRVNHRFGEGASPRLRQVREGLEAVGIEASTVLHHATPRLFYGCKLSPDAVEQLFGIGSSEATSRHSVDAIADAWRRRWLVTRAQNPDVLARMSSKGTGAILAELRLDPSADAQAELPFEAGQDVLVA
jgi:hypothetical protein